jgi:hypothetical protein
LRRTRTAQTSWSRSKTQHLKTDHTVALENDPQKLRFMTGQVWTISLSSNCVSRIDGSDYVKLSALAYTAARSSAAAGLLSEMSSAHATALQNNVNSSQSPLHAVV